MKSRSIRKYGREINDALEAIAGLHSNPVNISVRMNSGVNLQTERMLLDELFIEKERNIVAGQSQEALKKMSTQLEELYSTRLVLGCMIDSERRVSLPGKKSSLKQLWSPTSPVKTSPERPWVRQLYPSTAATEREHFESQAAPITTRPFQLSPPEATFRDRPWNGKQLQELEDLASISPRSDDRHSVDDLDDFRSQFVEEARLRTEAKLRIEQKRKPLRVFMVKTRPKYWKNPKYAHIESQYAQANLGLYHGSKRRGEHESSLLFEAEKRHYWGKSEEACLTELQKKVGSQFMKEVTIEKPR